MAFDERKCVISRNVKFHEELVYKDVIIEQDGTTSVFTKRKSDTSVKAYTEIKVKQVAKPEERSESGGASQEEVVELVPKEEQPVAEVTDQGILSNYQLVRDMVRRNLVPPSRFDDYTEIMIALAVLELMSVDEPKDFTEAKASKDWKKWNGATDEEMDSLRKNMTWILVDKPKDRKVINCTWLFKIKHGI